MAEHSVDYLSFDDAALLAQCEVDIYRASGPGGQNRNKVSSAVRIRHLPTGLIVTATESRSQRENRVRALKRIRQSIALHVRTVIDLEDYTPGEVLASCISQAGRLVVGRRDQRYYQASQEVLDLLVAGNLQVSRAASLLGISTANLVSFLGNDPKLWERVNQLRQSEGLKPLRK